MKKNVFLGGLAITSLALVFLGCVSITPQNVEHGKVFKDSMIELILIYLSKNTRF